MKAKTLSSLSTKELNDIYTEFMNFSEKTYGFKLKKEDKDYLVKRGLTEEQIDKKGYFSMPNPCIMGKFMSHLKDLGLDEKLKEVPGFYYNHNYNIWTFFNLDSIIIPIKNEYEEIVALQLRDKNPASKIRYIWFSSAFASGETPNEKGLSNGTSCGAPLSIVYSDTRLYDDIFIVEGDFKAQALAKLGYDVISVQGIFSINSSVLDTLKNIEKIRGYKINQIKIAFDADMIFNVNVLKAINKVINILYSNKTVISMWDYKKGKGIDDYLEYNNLNSIKFIPSHIFESLSTSVISTCKSLNLTVSDKNETAEVFNNTFSILI